MLQLFFLAAIAAVHIRVQHFDQRFIGFAHFGLGPMVFGLENINRLALGRGQFAGMARRVAAAGVAVPMRL